MQSTDDGTTLVREFLRNELHSIVPIIEEAPNIGLGPIPNFYNACHILHFNMYETIAYPTRNVDYSQRRIYLGYSLGDCKQTH